MEKVMEKEMGKVIEKEIKIQTQTEGEDYIFVSYSHVDMIMVEGLVRALQHQGCTLWYDENGSGIDPGSDWKSFIDGKLTGASVCLLILSKDAINRGQVMREFLLMQEHKKRIIPVLLEEIPTQRMKEEVLKNYLAQNQAIKVRNFGGVNRKFIQALLQALGQVPVTKLQQSMELERENVAYIYDNGFPVKASGTVKATGKNYDYYRLTVGDISPDAAFPEAMDNQWFTQQMYLQEEFSNPDKQHSSIGKEKLQIQKKELIQALFHSRQVLLNRAFYLNSPIFHNFYSSGVPGYTAEEEQAFASLMETGVFVVFLLGEEGPADLPAFDFSDTISADWVRFCQTHALYCLKFDWDQTSNYRECQRNMTIPMFEFCMTVCDDPYRIQSLAYGLQIPEEKIPLFSKRLHQLRTRVLAVSEEASEKGRDEFFYSRNMFYQDFVTAPGSNVADTVLDQKKPFAAELKQIADLKYNCNFADACRCVIREPQDSLRRDALLEVDKAGSRRELSVDELTFAIAEFQPAGSQEKVQVPKTVALDLATMKKMRDSSEGWNDYLQNMELMSNRAQQWLVDFNPIQQVMDYFKEALSDVVALLKKKGREQDCVWMNDAISIIYQIDNYRIITVYDLLRQEKKVFQQGGYIQTGMSGLKIFFQYGNALSAELSDTISTKILFFRGTTNESGKEYVTELMAFLLEDGFLLKQAR